MNSNKQTDDLVQGIKLILSKNRRSFLESEQETLIKAIKYLESNKKENNPLVYGKLLLHALEIVAKFFLEDFDKFKNLF